MVVAVGVLVDSEEVDVVSEVDVSLVVVISGVVDSVVVTVGAVDSDVVDEDVGRV